MAVNAKIQLTFAAGLRTILRQDPDVIMVGEIRDLETAQVAVQASLTGHLVFSTVHTNDAPSTITRLVDMGVKPYLVASSFNAMIAQRLVRVVCPECKEAYEPPDHELEEADILREHIPDDATFFKAVGCEKCGFSGYAGRTAIFEIMMIDDDIRKMILRNEDSNAIKKYAMRKKAMTTLRHDAIRKAMMGVTTIQEALFQTQGDKF